MDEVQTQDALVASPAEKTSTERMIPQSEVDKIVHMRTREAYEKAQREAQLAGEAAKAQRPVQEVQQSMGGMPQYTQEQIRQMISEEANKRAEEAYKRALEEQAMNMANDFVGKLESGKTKYDPKDFQETMDNLNLQANSHLIKLSGGLDNTADVYYHLGKNGTKLAQLSLLALTNPKIAQMELHKLSDSLKTNESAANMPSINEPLSQLKRTTVGADNGKKTISDLRQHPAFRV